MINSLYEITALDIVGGLTVLISSVGAIIALRHWSFFIGNKAKLARRLRAIFFTDAMVYVATLFFGLWAWTILQEINPLDQEAYHLYYEHMRIILYTIRIFALVGNIVAAAMLYHVYAEISQHARYKDK